MKNIEPSLKEATEYLKDKSYAEKKEYLNNLIFLELKTLSRDEYEKWRKGKYFLKIFK